MNSKFDRLFNTIMEEAKASKIKAKKVIKEDEDWDDDQDSDYPTITVGDLRKELQKADPDEIIWFSWNTYSDGGEDCCGFDYNENTNTFYLNQFTHISEDEEQEEEPNYDYAPSAEEVLIAIKDIPDDVKVFSYWDENEGARYCISKIRGTHIELDGGTEC